MKTLELEIIKKEYPKFYEYLDKNLLHQTEFYYYRQLYDIFDKLNYFVTMEQEATNINYKIYPPPEKFIKYKSGFKNRQSAEIDAFEYLINLFETGKININ